MGEFVTNVISINPITRQGERQRDDKIKQMGRERDRESIGSNYKRGRERQRDYWITLSISFLKTDFGQGNMTRKTELSRFSL